MLSCISHLYQIDTFQEYLSFMSNSEPLVTIAVASYNHEAYIEICLLSLLEQSYKNIELIVIDDGSSDNSCGIIKNLKKHYEFQFYQQSNIGFNNTLNRAIKMAKGKYFCYLGSDDIALIDKTARQVALMESRPDIAVCGGNVLNIDSNGQILAKQKIKPFQELDFEDVFVNKKGLSASTTMIRMEVLRKEGGYDPTIQLEDVYMWLKLTSRGYRLAVLNDLLVYYRKHPTNTYKSYGFMYDNMMATYAPYKEHPKYSQVVNNYCHSSLIAVAKSGNRKKAWEIFREISPQFYSIKTIRGLLYLLIGGKQARAIQ